MKGAANKSRHNARLILEELEPRRLFSGGIEGLIDHGDEQLPYPLYRDIDEHAEARQATNDATLQEETRSSEIVFVDANVENYEKFVQDLGQNDDDNRALEVVVLDRDRDGVEQISVILQDRDDIDAVHIISHGSDGNIELGNTSLDATSLEQGSDLISAWSEAFSESGDLLIYGCDLAASDAGKSLIDTLATLTGADVAASSDLTGAASLGGDWNLEYHAGTIEGTVVVSAELQQNYQSALAATAVDDSYNIDEDSVLTVAAPGVLANDIESNGDPMTVTRVNGSMPDVGTQVTLASGALLTVNADGSFEYDTNGVFENLPAGSNTTDSFTYDARGVTGPSSTGTVTITIDGVNDDPVVSPVDVTGTISEGGTVTDSGSINFTDVDLADRPTATEATASIVSPVTVTPAQQAAIENAFSVSPAGGNTNNGTINWDYTIAAADLDFLDAGETLTATFTVTIDDGNGGIATQDVVITINGAEDASSTIGSQVLGFVGEDATLIAGGTLVITDADTSDNPVSFPDFGPTPGLAGYGTFEISGNTWTYTLDNNHPQVQALDAGDSLGDSYTFTATDGSTIPVTIFINGSNDGPTIGDVADFGFTEDADASAQNLSAAGTVTFDDIDADDVVDIAVSLTTPAAWSGGSIDPGLAAQLEAGFAASVTDAAAPGSTPWTYTVNNADLDFLQSGETITLTFTLTATDSQGAIATDDVTITINGTYDAPIFSASGAASVIAGDTYTLNLSVNQPITSWTVNWGDGTIDTIAGNLSSANHVYAEGNAGLTHNISVSVTDGVGTYLENNLVVAGAASDALYLYEATSGNLLQEIGAADDLDYAADVTIGPDGLIYVTGYNSDNVLRYNATTGAFVDEFISNGTAGLDRPVGLAFGPDGNIYIANSNDAEILRFDATTGAFIDTFVSTGSGGLTGPEFLLFTPSGDLLVSDYTDNDVLRFDGTTGAFIDTFVAAGSGGLGDPEQMTFGPDGHLYIASDANSNVLRFHGSSGNFIDQFVIAGTGGLTNATGIAFGPDGNLYVSSWSTDTVLRYQGPDGASPGTFIDPYASGGGLDQPVYLAFVPSQQVQILAAPVATEPVATDDPGVFTTDVLAQNPVSYWRLGDGGGAASDLGSSGNDGSYNGATLGQAGAISGDNDSAVRFDGATDYVEIAHSNDYLLDEGTLQVWFNVDDPTNGGRQHLFSKDSAGLDDGGHLSMAINASGQLEVRLQSTTTDYYVTSAASVNAGQWHHAAFSFGAGGMQLYLDGVLVDNNSYGGGMATSSGGSGNVNNIAIGAGTRNSGSPDVTPVTELFTGVIDEVALFGGQLDAQTISQLYTAGNNDYQVTQNGTLSVSAAEGVLANDFDAQGDTLSVLEVDGSAAAVGNPVNLPSGALLTLNSDGSLDYDPNGQFDYLATGETGADTFAYTLSDGNGGTDAATVTISITGTNDPVTITSGSSINHAENTTAVGNIGAVDPDASDTLTYSISGGADQGFFSIDNGTGALSFNSAPDFETPLDSGANNTYQVEVTVDDGNGSTDVQMITVTVTDANESATAIDDAYTVDEDSTLASDDAWFDSDWLYRRTLSFDNSARTEDLVDFPILVRLDSSVIDYAKTHDSGDDLRFFDQDGTQLAHEIETWDESGISYVWVKVPQIDGSSGTDSILMYYGNAGVASDGQDAAGVWSGYQAAYHLNENPGAGGTVSDSAGNFDATNSGSTNTAGIIGNAQSFDGSTDYIDLGDNRPWINNASGVTMSIWMNADSISSGNEDLIGVTVNDTVSTSASRFTLIQNDDEIRLIARTMDDNSDPVTVQTSSSPLVAGQWHHVTGTVDYSSDVDNIKIYVDGVLQGTFSHDFTLSAIPNSDSSSAVIGSNEGGGSGHFDGLLDEARIMLGVQSEQFVAAQYAAMTGSLVSVGYEHSVNGVLANDYDGEGDALVVGEVNGNPAAVGVATALPSGAILTLNADGSFVYDTNSAFESLGAGASTIDTFTYLVDDGMGNTDTATVTMTITGVDDPAIISGDSSYVGNEGDAVGGDLDATDVEGLTDGTYFSLATLATNGAAYIDPTTGVWSFVPTDPNWSGSDSFSVTVTDDQGGTTTQVISITLAAVDDPAVISGDISYSGNEGDAIGGDMNASDVEGLTDGTYFAVTGAATNGSAVIDPASGVWTFTPADPNWFGSDSFTVTVTDDLGGTTTQIVSITLANIDDPAIISGDISYSGNEGDAVGGDMDASDVEGLTDGTYFTVTGAATNGTAVIDPASGVWTFTPTDPDWFGSDSFTVTITDDLGGSTTQVVNITLANVDDPAVISGDVSYSGNEGDAVGGDMDASDVEGLTDGTYFTVTGAATNGSAVIDPATGVWTFTPTDPNWFGSDSFTVTITDDLGGSTTQVVNITLANVDDPAVISGDVSYSGNEGDAVGGDMDASDVEGLTDGTYFTVTGAATNGSAVIDPDTGVWTFTPTDPDWFGSDSFTVTITDDLGGTTTQVVSITLANVDDSAVISGDVSYSGNEGDAVGGDMDASDVEGLTDGTYFTVTGAATNGTAVIDPATGVWTFTPTDPDWFGSDSFTVTVTDDLGGTTTQVVNITLANVDDPAVISGDVSYAGNEGDAVGGDMDASDIDGLTDGAYFTVTGAATNGSAVIDPATGVWTFTPTDPDWFGSDSFTVTITDDLGGTATQVVNITLANVDDPAIISGDLGYTGNEGDAVGGDMDASDVEGLADGTYFTITAAATNGSAVIDPATGVWTFTPTDPNWFGSDSFTVTVTDDLGGTTTQIVSVTLTNVDDPAIIGGDVGYTGNEGDAVGGTMTATDVEGLTDGTVFSVTSPASNGSAAIDPASGAWTFTPTDPNWFGSDSFTVTVTDDLGGTTTQVVNITLANVDDPAVISGDVSYSGSEGDAVGGDMDATDVEGLTDGTVFTVTGAATNGTAAIDPATGVWTFTPTDPNWFGSDSFTVTVTDDLGGTTTQVVNITLANVDDPAIISGDVSYSGNEGDAVGGDMDATDVEGLTDGTYFTVTGAATNGTAAIDPATGVWTFTPTDPNWFGSDSFTVTVTDDLGGTTTQVVNITLANVDDPAIISGDVSYSGSEGDAVGGDMDATDVEGLTDGTYFTVTGAATNGTAAIDPATGVWTFTPTDPNWFGSDSFTVTVTDDLGGTTTQVVNITLANVDDPAVISGDISYSGNEGDAVGGDMDATDVEGLSDGTYFTVTGAATNGTAAIDPATGVWTFTPTDPNWFGSDSFTVTVTDDLGGTTTQVVNITLANVDDPAVISGDISYSGNEGDAVGGDMDATDVEGLSDGTYFTVTGAAANGTAAIDPATGVWTFTPTDPDWFGSDSFTVTITDDLGATTTQVVNITLANVDDPAVISGDVSYLGNEGDAVGGDMDATDVEGLSDGTYFTVTGAAANGTAVIDPATGVWTFTPADPDWFGSDSFTVTITDDLGGTNAQVINITLANVDDPAVISGDVSYSGNEGDAVGGDMDASDVEGLTDGTYFTVTGAATNGSAVIDPATGVWTFTPADPNWFGSDSFTVTVTDDLGGTTTQVVNITLANVDDPAVISGDISYSGNEGDAVGGDMDATDVEGLTDGTYFTVTGAAANGTAAIDPATGVWTFTPTDPDWFGSDSFTVTITDDLGGTTTQVVNITLANVDDPAVIAGDVSYSGNEGDAVGGDMDATDVEGLSDGTYFTVSSAATNGAAVIDPATGVWTFTPTDPDWFGSDSFTVTITDDLGGTTTQVVNITLVNVDDPAVIGGDTAYSGNEGDTVTGTLTATDVEGLTDGTYFTVTAPAANGTASIDPATGAWSFTPADINWYGSDSFTVTVTDDLGGTTTQVVSVTLAPVNDPAFIGGTDTGSVTEDVAVIGGMISTGGALTVSDVDAGESSFQAETVTGSYGELVIDVAGNWTYTADNSQAAIQQLDVGETLVETLTIRSFDGTTHDVTVTVYGAEDAPLLGGVASGNTWEDGVATASNLLTISDVDTSDNPIAFNDIGATLGDNGYGDFSMSGNTWSYVLNNSHAAVQALDAGESMTDSFTFLANDGSSQLVTVTINGAEDNPTVDNPIPDQAATEDSPFSYTFAANTFGDLDTSDLLTYSATLNGGGPLPAWLNFDALTRTFSGTPANADVGTISIRVTADDGTSTIDDLFDLTVVNSNDAPVISGSSSGSVQEDVDVVGGSINASGRLTIADPDVGESSFVPATINGTYGTLTIDAAGNWSYIADNNSSTIQSLHTGETLTDTFTVQTADGTDVDVVININGSEEPNDTESAAQDDDSGPRTTPDDPLPEPVVFEAPESVDSVAENLDDPDAEDVYIYSQVRDSGYATTGDPDGIDQFTEAPATPLMQVDLARLSVNVNEIEVEPAVFGDTDPTVHSTNFYISEDPELDDQYERALLQRLELLRGDIGSDSGRHADNIEVQVFIGATTTLTAGIVSWVLRAGSLLASLMGTVPLLNRFDPLPILKHRNDEEDVEEDDDTTEITGPVGEDHQRVDDMFEDRRADRSGNRYQNE